MGVILETLFPDKDVIGRYFSSTKPIIELFEGNWKGTSHIEEPADVPVTVVPKEWALNFKVHANSSKPKILDQVVSVHGVGHMAPLEQSFQVGFDLSFYGVEQKDTVTIIYASSKVPSPDLDTLLDLDGCTMKMSGACVCLLHRDEDRNDGATAAHVVPRTIQGESLSQRLYFDPDERLMSFDDNRELRELLFGKTSRERIPFYRSRVELEKVQV